MFYQWRSSPFNIAPFDLRAGQTDLYKSKGGRNAAGDKGGNDVKDQKVGGKVPETRLFGMTAAQL